MFDFFHGIAQKWIGNKYNRGDFIDKHIISNSKAIW